MMLGVIKGHFMNVSCVSCCLECVGIGTISWSGMKIILAVVSGVPLKHAVGKFRLARGSV
jgi:hypothetical protein